MWEDFVHLGGHLGTGPGTRKGLGTRRGRRVPVQGQVGDIVEGPNQSVALDFSK